jgi:hypothetical protein
MPSDAVAPDPPELEESEDPPQAARIIAVATSAMVSRRDRLGDRWSV